MQTFSIENFNKLPMLEDNHRVRRLDDSVYKLCSVNIEYLNHLKNYRLEHFSTPEEIFEEKQNNHCIGYITKSKFLKDYIPFSELDISKYSVKEILILFKKLFQSLYTANKNGLFVNDIHGYNILINPENLDYQFFDFDTSFIIKDEKLFYEESYALDEVSLHTEAKRYFNKFNIYSEKTNLILEEKHFMLMTIINYLYANKIISIVDLKLIEHMCMQLDLPDTIKERFRIAYTYGTGFDDEDYLIDIFDYLIKFNYTLKKGK